MAAAVADRRPGRHRLRIGLIGAGDMSRYHIAAWRKIPDVDVVAICALHLERAASRAAEFGIAAAYEGARAMLDAEDLDAVDIATWRETHVELTLLAAERGVHVLCQKPLAPSLGEATDLARAVDGRIRLMVHENRRFAPHFRTIRRWIDEGKVGQIRQVVMTTWRSSLIAGPDGRRPSVERASYFGWEPRLMIGEALIHQLDVLRYLLGPLRVVAARTARTEPDLPGETLATILLETEEGRAPVVLAGSYVAPGLGGGGNRPGSPPLPAKRPDSGETTALGASTTDRLEILGSVSSLQMTDAALELHGGHDDRVSVDYASTYQACFDAAAAHFVERLRSGEPFETSPDDNLETLRLVEDAYAMAEPGAVIFNRTRGTVPR
jgi:predicted dehydrogenase